MGNQIDLEGYKFNKLTIMKVLEEKDSRGYFKCICKCDCGNEIITTASRVKRGRTQSCGCLRKGYRSSEDLTGRKFGRLTPVKRVKNSMNKVYWECKCDCGNIKVVRTDWLKSGSIKSCGCLWKETSRKALNLVGNKYGRLTVIRNVGYDKNGLCLCECKCECGNIRIIPATRLNTGRTKSCGCISSEHIKRLQPTATNIGRYGGTKVGLISSKRQNKNNTSGIKGVYWIENRGMWRAMIGFQGKNIYLGQYRDKEDAIKARKEAEEKYHRSIIEEYKNQEVKTNE